MKFRTIFLLFNGVLLLSFIFVFIMPLVLLGWDFSVGFWKDSWYIGLFFAAALVVINLYYGANRTLFALFEREDWDGLSAWLVERIFVKWRYSALHVRYLADTYFLKGDLEGFKALEAELAARNPAVLARCAVIFGFVRILEGRNADAAAFLEPYLGRRDVEAWEWLRFGYAFALLGTRDLERALPQLLEGSSSRDPVLALLAAWLLDTVGRKADSGNEPHGRAVEAFVATYRRKDGAARLDREIARAKGEFHVVVLSRLIPEARTWLDERAASAR